MSAIESITYKCDHCGFSTKSDEGDGDLGWLHANGFMGWEGGSVLVIGDSVDLCPNCVSELKAWLRAGPQHEEYRRQLKAQESVADTRRKERMALSRHPAQNTRTFMADHLGLHDD
jgi:hypothetical protein